MKTRHYENENSNCFRVVPANYFVVLYSFTTIIKLALSSSYADPEFLVPFNLCRYSSLWTLVSLWRRHASIFLFLRLVSSILIFLRSVTWPSGPCLPFPIVFFPIGIQLWRTSCKATVYFFEENFLYKPR